MLTQLLRAESRTFPKHNFTGLQVLGSFTFDAGIGNFVNFTEFMSINSFPIYSKQFLLDLLFVLIEA